MNLPDVPLLSMLRERMAWLEARQNVLSQNVSNADVPGYVARDLKPVDFSQLLRQSQTGSPFAKGLVSTNPRHIAVGAGAMQFDTTRTPEAATSPGGNSVSLEEEMIKVSDTEAQFQAATNLYAKALQLMRTAIGHSGQ